MRRFSSVTSGLIALASFTAVSLAANLWIAAHRMEGYNYCFASYDEIYEPAEEVAVERLRWSPPGLLEVELSGAAWPTGPTLLRLTGEGATHEVPLPGGDPRGVRRFRADPDLRLFTTSDLRVGARAGAPLSELTYRAEQYPAADVAEVSRLLRDEAGVAADDATEVKLEKVWRYLFRVLDARRGTPPAWLHRLPVLEQYRRLLDGSVRGHCNVFARILALFATVAGVPARVVDTNRDVDGVQLSAHTFVEVYLPEVQRWAYTDVTLSVLWVRDRHTGRTLSAVQLAHLLEAGATGGLVVTTCEADGALRDVPLAAAGLAGELMAAYLNHNATFVFHRLYADRGSAFAWLHRYVIDPEPAYSLHADDRRHWIKVVCFYLLVAQGAVWVALVGRWTARALRARRARRLASSVTLTRAGP